MNLEVKFTPAMVESPIDLRRKTVVVIDTLRATSTIVAALMAGAREVAPVASAEDAVAVAQRLGTERTLLCGERGSLKIEGFHLGNSPAEYTPGVIQGKTLLLTTTNGTLALLKARDAERVLCGSLLNARAVALDLAAYEPEEVCFLCAGRRGSFSTEDALAAGAIIDELVSLEPPGLSLDDSAEAVRQLFTSLRHDLEGALSRCDHGRTIIELGMRDDVRFCSQLNIEGAAVPVLVGSTIKLAEQRVEANV